MQYRGDAATGCELRGAHQRSALVFNFVYLCHHHHSHVVLCHHSTCVYYYCAVSAYVVYSCSGVLCVSHAGVCAVGCVGYMLYMLYGCVLCLCAEVLF